MVRPLKPQMEIERQLMLAVAKGDEKAFDRLMADYLKDVHRLCQRLMRRNEDAEDAAQDAFTKIWRQAWRFDATKGSLRTWILSVTSRACLDRLRRRKGFEARPGRENIDDWSFRLGDGHPSAIDQIQTKQRADALLAGLDKLKPQARLVLVLTYLEDHTQLEAAKIMGLGLKAFEGRLARAKDEMKKILQREDH